MTATSGNFTGSITGSDITSSSITANSIEIKDDKYTNLYGTLGFVKSNTGNIAKDNNSAGIGIINGDSSIKIVDNLVGMVYDSDGINTHMYCDSTGAHIAYDDDYVLTVNSSGISFGGTGISFGKNGVISGATIYATLA
jgi:hypothetical protein